MSRSSTTFKPDYQGTSIERFWKKVNKNGPIPEHKPELGPCWLWTGMTGKNGYGFFYVQYLPKRRLRAAHTYLYEMENGPLPNGLVPDHLCRNRGCVNPSHLEPVTMKENTLRGIGPAAVNARKTHCKRGHMLSGWNARINSGTRHCRTCENLSTRDKRRRIAAARRAGAAKP